MSAERIERALRSLCRPLAGLRPDPANARLHDARNLAAIRASLEQFGQQKPIVLAKDGRTVIAGNGTLEVAKRLGWKRIAAVRSSLTAAAARAYGLADNRTAELATWDRQALRGLLEHVQRDDAALLSKLWSATELEHLSRIPGAQAAEAEEAPPPPPRPRSRRGVYELGVHRLLCGDARNATLIARFLGEQRAQVLWTDPPYGVEYEGRTKAKLRIGGDTAKQLPALLEALFRAADPVLAPGARFYIAAPAGPNETVVRLAIAARGWRLHQSLVWVKDAMVLGHSDYHYRHEPILCGCKPLPERHETVLYGHKPGRRRIGRGGAGWYAGNSETTVFEIPRPKRSVEHPTMKPVALVEAHLRNSSAPGEVVYDCCAGSGTTLIAAHRLGRVAYVVEQDPRYCDVIRRRYADLVGDPALRP